MEIERKATMKRLTLAFLAFLALTSVVWAASKVYEWWSPEITIQQSKITGAVTWQGLGEVGYPIEVNVTITNARATSVSGNLTVQVYDSSRQIIVATLTDKLPVTIGADATWTDVFTWTPTEAGSYYAKATFTED